MGIFVVSGSYLLMLFDNNLIIVKNFGIFYIVFIIDEVVKWGLKILIEVELSYLIFEVLIIVVMGINGKMIVIFLIGDMFKKSCLIGRLFGNIGYVVFKVV